MDNKSPEILFFAILGNTLNILYNIPFVYRVFKNKSANNISSYFLIMRLFGSISWIIYAILESELWIGLSYIVTLISSICVSYIKIKYKNKTIKDEYVDVDVDENVDEDADGEASENNANKQVIKSNI